MTEFQIKTLFPTPQHFFEFAETFSNRIYDRDGVRRVRILYEDKNIPRDSRFVSDTPPIVFYVGAYPNQKNAAWWTNNDNVGAAKVIVQRGPGATTFLFVNASEEVWKKVEVFWKLLRDEMSKQGWLETHSENRLKKTTHKAPESKRWDSTEQKLKELRKQRLEWMNKHGGKPPRWTVACATIGIDTKTAKKHDPELKRRWEDKEFREL